MPERQTARYPAATAGVLACLAVLAWCTAAVGSGFVCGGSSAARPPDRTGSARPAALAGRGRVHAVVILAGFPDRPRPDLPPGVADRLFDPDLPGSLAHFYDTMSAGRFHLGGQVLPRRYVSSLPSSAYTSAVRGQPGEYGRFVLDILDQVDADVDFARFDADGPDGIPASGDDDGIVDYVFIVLPAIPRGFLVDRADGIAGLGIHLDHRRPSAGYVTGDRGAGGRPVSISTAVVHGSVLEQGRFARTVGIMAHEFGHALGLPDLYDLDYDDPVQDSGGIGRWGLMGRGAEGWNGDDGPMPFCAWSLAHLGWIGAGNGRLVTFLDDHAEAPLRDVFAGGAVYRIPLHAVRADGSPVPASGALLVERRERDAHYYNRSLPAEGVLVWWSRDGGWNNDDETRKAVDLVCADGLWADAGFPLGRRPDPFRGRDNLDFWAHDEAYAAAHGGNLGDVTDLFARGGRTRFDDSTNPSVLSLLDLDAEAATLPALSLSLRGAQVRLSATLPRWAGLIRDEVHWAGRIHVDGDVEIAPGGRLVIHPSAEVHFAAADRRHTGRDPNRCELLVRGRLEVRARPVAPAVLRAVSGATWYGLVVAAGADVRLERGALELRDALRGIDIPGKPPEAADVAFGVPRLLDDPRGRTAGNGDGHLQPGETIQLEVPLGNWTFNPLQRVRVQAQADHGTQAWPVPDEVTVDLPPTSQVTLRLPALTLDPDLGPGDSLSVRLSATAGDLSVERRIHLPIHPGPAAVSARLRLDGRGAEGRILTARDDPPTLVAVPSGPVAGVDFVAVDANGLTRTFTTRRRAGAYQATVEVGVVSRLATRVRLADGSTRLAGPPVTLDPVVPTWADLLVLSGVGIHRTLSQRLAAVLPLSTPASFVRLDDQRDDLDDWTLPRYLAPGRVVLWAGGRIETTLQDRLARFVARGGALIVAAVPRQWQLTPSLLEVLPFAAVRLPRGRALHSPDGSIQPFRALLSGLLAGLAPEAQVVLADENGAPVGVRGAPGTFRVVYLAVDLQRMPSRTAGVLLSQALALVADPSPVPAVPPPVPAAHLVGPLELVGVDLAGPVRRAGDLAPAATVRNPGGGPVAGARLVLRLASPVGGSVEDVAEVPYLAPGHSVDVRLPERSLGETDYDVTLELVGLNGRLDSLHTSLRVAAVDGDFRTQTYSELDHANGAAAIDHDGDGDPDLYVVRLGQPNVLYVNTGDALQRTAVGAEDAGLGRCAAIGDDDGDGDLDLYVVNQGPNRLYRNRSGRFLDAARHGDATAATVLADAGSGRSAAFFDADGDGDLDLYLVNAHGTNRLFRRRGEGWVDVADAAGVADAGDGRGLAVGDVDSDGEPDLYVADQGPGVWSELYLNGSSASGQTPTFVAASRHWGLSPSPGAVAAVLGDVDGDGDLDLFVSSQLGANRLWRNQGDRFDPIDADLGRRSTGAALFDYDNDGDLDLAVTGVDTAAGGDQVFHNRGRGGFVPVGRLLGLRERSTGRGLTFADFDGDGMHELVVAGVDETCIYHSQVRHQDWLEVVLHGLAANTSSLGARVEVSARGRRQVRDVQAGFGYGSQVPPWSHFGLGDAGTVDWVRVTWPDGSRSTHAAAPANQRLEIAHPLSGTRRDVRAFAPPRLTAAPNPFNAETLISYRLDRAGEVILVIYDLAGQRIRTLVQGPQATGRHTVRWDGTTATGPAASGVYLVRLNAAGRVVHGQVLLLR